VIRACFAICLAICAALLCPRTALAHDSQPLLVRIDEQAPLVYRIRIKLPPSMRGHRPPLLVLSRRCEDIAGISSGGGDAFGQARLVSCDAALEGGQLSVEFPDFNPSLAIFFRYQPLEGPVLSSLQPPDSARWQVPVRSGARQASLMETGRSYVRLGIEHFFTGLDHLLFAACLLMIAGGMQRIVLAVTGFTLAHSLTLGLAALGVMRPPPAIFEALIALSVVVLAAEIVRDDRTTLVWRRPMVMAIAFGLLHGFGFAAVLGEIGLPANQELVALLSFNIGVEIGQIAFIVLLLALAKGVGTLFERRRAPAASMTAGAYAIGTVASFWLIQRITLF
jgi:hypothetical protein